MSDYNHFRKRYQDISGTTQLAAADDLSATARQLAAGRTDYTIYIQRILVNVLTDNAATLTFQDEAGTPVVIAKTKASPGIGPILYEFGPRGIPLTVATDFNLANSAAGLAAAISWEGYRKPTGTMEPSGI